MRADIHITKTWRTAARCAGLLRVRATILLLGLCAQAHSDLVRNVTASTKEENFEKAMLTGGDIFSLTVDRTVDNIEDFVDFCFEKYQQETYKARFDWVDNILAVREKSLCSRLDSHLIDLINQRQYDYVWMAVPEVISWEEVKHFRYAGDVSPHDDIYIEKVIGSARENQEITVDYLRQKPIRAISATDELNEYKRWNAYKCLVAEFDFEGHSYCLNNGKWYKVDTNFAQTVNREYEEIALCDIECCEYSSDGKDQYNENNYNEELVAHLGTAALIHRVGEIPYGGGRGNRIEVCDVLTSDRKLLHIKKNASSSYLSHLFNQAAVSAEALLDIQFRNKWEDKLRESAMDAFIDDDFQSSNYTIVLGIINKFTDARPKIPFFSRVSIRYTARAIKNMGYAVSLKNILNVTP